MCLHAGLSCLVRPGFFLSFYFWLDTVAVLSLAFELPALRAALLLGETQVRVTPALCAGRLLHAPSSVLLCALFQNSKLVCANCANCAGCCAHTVQDFVNLNNEDSYLMAAGAQALVSSKAGRAAKVRNSD
jgi:hypothetical protein